MRTKTVFIAAAALAAGLTAASAQQVYSQNIVGYVNVVMKGNAYTLLANPLDNGTNNDANSLLGSLPNKSTILTWGGSSFTSASKGSSGFTPNPTLPVGTGFFVKNFGSTDITNTFVGNVIISSGGSFTNSLPGGNYALVGSPLPYAEDLNGTNLNLAGVLPNKTTVLTWDNSGSGTYVSSSKGSSGFSPDQSISVAQGFFVKNFGSTTNWVQTLP